MAQAGLKKRKIISGTSVYNHLTEGLQCPLRGVAETHTATKAYNPMQLEA
jgi:hypothetical protein